MAAENFTVEPAGAVKGGAGHMFHNFPLAFSFPTGITQLGRFELMPALLAVLMGVALLGLFGLRHQGLWPRWSSALFLLALPASLIFIFTVTAYFGLPFVIAGILAGALAAWPGTRPALTLEAL
jgi:hypothetical protein